MTDDNIFGSYGEYDPTLPEPTEDSKTFARERPHNARFFYGDLKCGDLFQTWPDRPNQVGVYGKFFIRWIVVTDNQSWGSRRQRSVPQVSIDGHKWHKLEELVYSKKNAGPYWWSAEEFIAEVEKKVKVFKRNRSRLLAERRRKKLEDEAKKAGMELEEFKRIRSEKLKKDRAKNKRKRTGQKLAKQLNRKMQIAMVLKDLREAADTLQAKLEDESIELQLAYVSNKIPKIKAAQRALEYLAKESD